MSRPSHDSDARSRRSNERRRDENRGHSIEAPLHQQIVWGKQITQRNVTPETILELVARNVHHLSTRNLATAAHRLGKIGDRRLRQDPRLERLIVMCGQRISDFDPRGIANIAWGSAKTGITDPRFFKAVAAEATRRIGEFNAQAMANTVWAFATASVTADALFKAVAAEVPRRIDEFNAQDMAITVWAFACVGWDQHQIFIELGSSIAVHLNDFNEAQQSQLYLVALYTRVQWPDRDCPLSIALRNLQSAYTRLESRPSQFQQEVSTMMEQMGWVHTFEHETNEGFSLDLAQPESKLAVEVDGPSHYLKDLSRGENVVNGATRFKTRLLRSFGWAVAHISFLDWNHKSESERRQFVAFKLGELGIPVEDNELASTTTQQLRSRDLETGSSLRSEIKK